LSIFCPRQLRPTIIPQFFHLRSVHHSTDHFSGNNSPESVIIENTDHCPEIHWRLGFRDSPLLIRGIELRKTGAKFSFLITISNRSISLFSRDLHLTIASVNFGAYFVTELVVYNWITLNLILFLQHFIVLRFLIGVGMIFCLICWNSCNVRLT
jgi:hypothetical protein